MELEKHLVLNKYFLNLFGFNDFDELREKLKDAEQGYDSTERSYFVDVLVGLKSGWENVLLLYDRAIREYVERLRKNRKQPNFNLKYFQYLAVLFTEIFLDKYFNDKERFLVDLNKFLEKFNDEKQSEISPFTEGDLKKLAFWMATGSGKTLIMHINYWQVLKYSKNNWDNIILITPNEGLSRQHYEELKLSGIPCKLYDGNIDNLKTKRGEILIINIQKLTEEKKGEGASVDISYFDGKNLVFIDEGHKGQRTEEQTWKKLREEIGKNGFLFEYSATFGQVIGQNKDLLEEYAKAIIFDYSYKYFYKDGYGKDFYVYNIKEDVYAEPHRDLLLTAGLLSFYEQLTVFEQYKEELREYNIEKPLWIFVGSTVIGKKSSNFSKNEKKTASDVEKVIKLFDKITKDEDYLKENVKKILEGRSELVDDKGNDIFKGKFEHIRGTNIDLLVEDIYQKVFGGKGGLELYEIKNAEGEIGLKTTTAEKYFGVINVGDVGTLKRLISESDIVVKEDHFSQSLFFGINESNSHINVLIGSKKFVEGWNSWRVSNMGLINMGKGEGPQIIQLFGRGVRLKGKDYSLKREENPDSKVKVLQTLFIFGLNADYINAFLSAIAREEVDYEEIAIPIRFNQLKLWEGQIYTIKTKENFDFVKYPVKLQKDDRDILRDIKIDLRPKISIASGLAVGTADVVTNESIEIPNKYFNLIDWDFVYSEIMNYKFTKGMFNLIIDRETIKEIAKLEGKKIFLSESTGLAIDDDKGQPVLRINSFEGIRKLHEIILMFLKEYILRFYRKEEKRKTKDNLEVKPLRVSEYSYMYPEDKKIILKIPKNDKRFENEIIEVRKQLEVWNEGKIPEKWKSWQSYIVHLDNHLYTPLIVWGKNKEDIKSVPVKLNEGETKFVRDFKNFLTEINDMLGNTNIFLLRNLSRKGIGFFLTSGFYPDFIIWIKKGNSQWMVFIDPKGIRNLGNFNDDKIQLCSSYIKEIEEKIKQEMKNQGEEVNLQLDAFILSVSRYQDIKKTFGEGGYGKEVFEDHNVVFQEDPDYLKKIFSKIGII